MFKKKICLLGEFGVGKTSLIRKYVLNVYSEKYISTVGVAISKKTVVLPSGDEVLLLIWDLEGQEDMTSYSQTHLRGLSGYILVADGTRPETLNTARKTREAITALFPEIPSVFLLNKYDLKDDWKITGAEYADFEQLGIRVLKTSAKTGIGVDEGFLDMAAELARKIDG